MDDEMRDVSKALSAEVRAAGVQRTERQLAELSLEDRATFVRGQIAAINAIMAEAKKKGAPYAINIGRTLLVTKAELRHGEFQAWVEKHCKLAKSSAKLYMLLARRAPELRQRGVNLNDMSVRAMREMVTAHEARSVSHRPGKPQPEQKHRSNQITRCVLLISDLVQNGDAADVEEHLLPELKQAVAALEKRLRRRRAVSND
jgi:Protein of unknown function (DUF3102)